MAQSSSLLASRGSSSRGQRAKAMAIAVVGILAVGGIARELHRRRRNHNQMAASSVQQKSKPVLPPAAAASSDLPPYNALHCENMHNGHCRDAEGGAWSYQDGSGACVHTEANVPRDAQAVQALPALFPDVKRGVLDFGGGVGAYLTAFRDHHRSSSQQHLVVLEPHNLGPCLFRGLQQDVTDLLNTPLEQLPVQQYDLVMTIEVCEHLPVAYHDHVLRALTQASRRYLLFSAAHPGQPGEGHVGASMKTRQAWMDQIANVTEHAWHLDLEKTLALHQAAGSNLLKTNAFVMRRRGA